MVGNTWYVAHRYTVHQLLDLVVHGFKHKAWRPGAYTTWLSKHIHDANLFPPGAEDLRQHVLFRSAQVIYLFILGEVLLVFAWDPAVDTVFARHRPFWQWSGIIVLAFACWQFYLSHSIDCYAVEQHGAKRGEGAA